MDKNRFVLKMGQLEKYLRKLKEILPESDAIYIKDDLRKLAVERLLQLCIEVVLDLSAMLVQYLCLGPPSDEENILDLLLPHLQIIPQIKEMKKFRNVLVHRYGDIDDHLVFTIALQGQVDFEQFLAEIRQKISNLQFNP